ncbi:MAG: HAD family hydrolase [Clostridia bacterium]|nr:HAD family hydrolase [Clostridia bacterium]
MNTKNIQWLFFDIGGTLADETESLRRRAKLTAEQQTLLGNACTQKDLENAMKKAALMGKSYFAGACELLGLSGMVPYDAIGEKLYSNAPSVLRALSEHYRLGIIANQPMGTENRLRAYGIRDYFSVILSSEEEGISKPNPELFIRALNRANCSAECAVMIGDRPDNDIAPAKALGMHTVRIRQGLGGLMPVTDDSAQADCTVDSLSELLDIFT